MAAAVVDRVGRRREARIGERADRDADEAIFVAFLGVEYVSSAYGTEAEAEAGAVVAGADVFGGGAGDGVGHGEAGERGEHAAGAALAGQAVADADAAWLALDFDAQLAAATGGGSRRHMAQA